jgi:hypothetical protein
MSDIYQIPIETNDASFKIRTKLASADYVLKIYWNDRCERWHISIHDANEIPILAGVPLNIDTDILARFRNPALPPGILMLYDTAEKHEEAGREDIYNQKAVLLYQEAS